LSDPFVRLFEKWFDSPARMDAAMKAPLLSVYREAWRSGTVEDRYAVLLFVSFAAVKEGFDLVLDGLAQADTAQTAGAHALALIVEGHDLGPRTRGDLSTYEKAFPEWAGFATSALETLDCREGISRAGGAD
jgi:hypothetical protein